MKKIVAKVLNSILKPIVVLGIAVSVAMERHSNKKRGKKA